MGNSGQRRKPRTFRWPRTARAEVAANINAERRQLRELITKLVQISGNPRDACLRFARQLGVKAKQDYRRWSKEDLAQMESDLEVHKVRKVAIRLGRTPNQVYGMMHRLGISGKAKFTDRISLYAVARGIRKHPRVVRQWIQIKALHAQNEGTEAVPRWMISQEDLQQFEKKHHKLIKASHVDRQCLKFMCEYVFPSRDDMGTRESKKERAAYEEQMEGEDPTID